MCGIIGVAGKRRLDRRDRLVGGRDTMVHRGPDDAGVWWSQDGHVGLGHRRLAIIDLSAGGHQPMHDATGLLTITFNGEIYNYRDLQKELTAKGHSFRSQSDTEVILAAYSEWGVECLSRFNGMFAFALYDGRKHSLFLARDRAGEKPLFYSIMDGELHFASELKGLMAGSGLQRQIDREALDCYLAMGFIPGDRCILHGVSKLPAAHALLFECQTGSMKVWRYWSLPMMEANSRKIDELMLLDELEGLLEDSVRRQMVADVPVGILLSGGVDSSLITAMAVRASTQIKTFTIGFPGFGKYDEGPYARLIANYFGTEHTELHAGNVGPDLLPMLARQYDEPVIDSSMIPTWLVSQLVRQHCTVALGGELWTKQRFGGVPRPFRSAVSYAAQHLLPIGFKGRNWLQALGGDLESELPFIGTFFDPEERRCLIGGEMGGGWPFVAEQVRHERMPSSADLLQRATRMEFENYMVEDILVKVDRASMLASLEIRAPLLDYRLVEFAFGRVPSSLKASANQRKILLKRLAARVLPPEFDQQRKQGFSIPLAAWLKAGRWREYFREVLLDRQCLFGEKI
ncbi:MAG: asparagine synthase (glutamine-hydrolyzing), partial [Proteobacteria bacterium]|nr:asparagine synthase (glutamine-hydrolyzing) [Pseudomonadota bacterium]